MIFTANDFLEDLKKYVDLHLSFAKSILEIPENKLKAKLSKESWSVLECLEHLNLYGDFYLPEFNTKIHQSKTKPQKQFKSGFLGNKLVKDMLPNPQMKTMNTFKSKNPIHCSLDKEKTILRFIEQQGNLKNLLESAKTKNIQKIKSKTTIPLLKLRLGDAFRFVIYHNERHIQQAKKVLKKFP